MCRAYHTTERLLRAFEAARDAGDGELADLLDLARYEILTLQAEADHRLKTIKSLYEEKERMERTHVPFV